MWYWILFRQDFAYPYSLPVVLLLFLWSHTKNHLGTVMLKFLRSEYALTHFVSNNKKYCYLNSLVLIGIQPYSRWVKKLFEVVFNMQILKESSPINFLSFLKMAWSQKHIFNLVKLKKNEGTSTNFFILDRKFEDSNSFHFLRIGPNKKCFLRLNRLYFMFH